jgi:beta-glucanase (GH16 family)
MTARAALAIAGAIGLLALAGCEGAGPLPPTAPPNGATGGGGGGGGGTLVWSDEFSGPAGASPSATRWAFDVGTDWGNAQLEYDTARPSNVSLDGQGRLAITARREAYQGQAYTSGRINTRGLFSRNGGRFEARIQLPTGRGIWPAFWLLGADVATVGWPTCGEIDVMEFRGQEPATIHGSLHGPGYSGGAALTRSFSLSRGGFPDGFHVFAVEWEPTRIRYLVDGVVYQTLTPSSLPSGRRWVFDHPFTILLNVAVGGNYVGPPDGTTTFPQTMLVDYVRVYALP